jgi:hypothetical protein
MNATAKGRAAIDVLTHTDFPFMVPKVFKLDEYKLQEYNFGPILRDNEIRFRIDTIEKSLALNPHFCTPEQVESFNYLADLVRQTERTQKFLLEEGDLVFINNKTMLHGRSQFEDRERYLLRVQMNKYD